MNQNLSSLEFSFLPIDMYNLPLFVQQAQPLKSTEDLILEI